MCGLIDAYLIFTVSSLNAFGSDMLHSIRFLLFQQKSFFSYLTSQGEIADCFIDCYWLF